MPGATESGVPISLIAITARIPAPGKPFPVPRESTPVSSGETTGSGRLQAQTAPSSAESDGSEPASATAGGSGPVKSTGVNPGGAPGATAGTRASTAPAGSATGSASRTSGAPAGGGAGNGSGQGPSRNGADGGGSDSSAPPGPVRTFTIPNVRGGIRAADWSDGSRRLTYPEGGAFDVVVLGAGLPPGLPPAETLLKGKPIYTTYIQVGADRDWILQFCAGPGSSSAPKRSGMVISLGDEPRMEAPYVQFAIIPMASPAGVSRRLLPVRATRESRLSGVEPHPASARRSDFSCRPR